MNTDTENLIISNQRVIMISLWEILGNQPHDRATSEAQHRLAIQIEQTESLLMPIDGHDDIERPEPGE